MNTYIIIMKLKPWEEIVGWPEEIKDLDGNIIAKISGYKVLLPKYMKKKLEKCKGKKIGILRTDIKGKEYLLRVEDGKNN